MFSFCDIPYNGLYDDVIIYCSCVWIINYFYYDVKYVYSFGDLKCPVRKNKLIVKKKKK